MNMQPTERVAIPQLAAVRWLPWAICILCAAAARGQTTTRSAEVPVPGADRALERRLTRQLGARFKVHRTQHFSILSDADGQHVARLTDTADEYLRERDMRQVHAFPQEYRYPFYHLEAAYLSDQLDQVGALLGFNGYRRIRGEVFLDWPDYEPAEPRPADLPIEVPVQWCQGRGTRPGIKVQACRDGQQIGTCECKSCCEFSRNDDAQDWFFTTSLGVAKEVQGKGLGRYLLQRALQEMHGVGYRHAAISTAWDNFRAFLFYSNHGYHVVDWTYGLSRDLE